MPSSESKSLWNRLSAAGHDPNRSLWGKDASARLGDLAVHSSLSGQLERVRGASVLIRTREQLAAALALIEIDGVARRLVLCPPDLLPEYIPAICATAEVDFVVSDDPEEHHTVFGDVPVIPSSVALEPFSHHRGECLETEWILLTSGTTGVPKTVVHTLASLAGAIKPQGPLAGPIVWSTFYDIRRYGGLQIYLRALLGGGSLVLSSAHESVGDFLTRAGSHGVTHMTGTPSHWRRALMGQTTHRISPEYARMSGEIADQAILDSLKTCYPKARVAHAFASTEAGVGFEVDDGLAGFPASFLAREGDVTMKVEDETLRIRSSRTALRYLGDAGESLRDPDGFVDTGDVLERRGERYYFIGRRGGIINVGGLKVHPEEVETVINRHPAVRMSLAKARRNPITGAVVVAEVVLASEQTNADPAALDALKRELLASCQHLLAPHKVPAAIRIVPSLDVAPSGKIARRDQ